MNKTGESVLVCYFILFIIIAIINDIVHNKFNNYKYLKGALYIINLIVAVFIGLFINQLIRGIK